jgi:hypothetical protein
MTNEIEQALEDLSSLISRYQDHLFNWTDSYSRESAEKEVESDRAALRTIRRVLETQEYMEYRCTWLERIAGQLYPFSGRIRYSFADAQHEAAHKDGVYNYFNVLIECREATDGPWPPRET